MKNNCKTQWKGAWRRTAERGWRGRREGRQVEEEVSCNGNFVSQAKNALRTKLGLATTTTRKREGESGKGRESRRDREGKWAKSRIHFAAFSNHFNCPNNAVAWAKGNPFPRISRTPPFPFPPFISYSPLCEPQPTRFAPGRGRTLWKSLS